MRRAAGIALACAAVACVGSEDEGTDGATSAVTTSASSTGGTAAGGSGTGGSTPSGTGGDGGGACAPSTPAITPWQPPRAPQAACDAASIDDYWTACLQPDSIPITCQQLTAAQPDCVACLLSSASDGEWGPLVELPGAVLLNRGGCVALETADAGADGCGARLHAADACALDACRQCPSATCEDDAVAGVCADADGATCAPDPSWEVCLAGGTPLERYRGVTTIFCGGG